MAQATDFSDAILLDAMRGGDREAFAVLFERYNEPIYRVLLRLLNRSDEARDVLQDTFLQLYRQPPRNGTAHNLRGWLYRVALNLGHNVLRAERRRAAREERSAGDTPRTEPDDPAGLALRNEERDLVRKVLAELRSDYQAALVLRYGGLSYAEIAAAVGTSVSNVGSLLGRAEKDFKARYLRVATEGGGSK